MMRYAVITINIVPACVNDFPVIVDTWMPLIGFVVADTDNIRTIILHRMKCKGWFAFGMTPSVPSTTVGNKNNAAVWKPYRIKIIMIGILQEIELR